MSATSHSVLRKAVKSTRQRTYSGDREGIRDPKAGASTGGPRLARGCSLRIKIRGRALRGDKTEGTRLELRLRRSRVRSFLTLHRRAQAPAITFARDISWRAPS